MNNGEILRNNKKYTLFDYIIIPVKIVPFHIAAKVINRLIVALTPSIQALAISKFIDTISAVIQNALPTCSIYGSLIVLALIVAYSYFNSSIMNVIDESANLRVDKVLRAEMLKQKASLRYQYIEKADTWDLLSRTCNDLSNSVMSGLNSILDSGGKGEDLYYRIT